MILDKTPRLPKTLISVDSTTLDLCLARFPRAKSWRTKAAIKLHTFWRCGATTRPVVIVTTGRVHDANVLDQLDFKPSSFYVFDRVWALGVIEKAKARLPFATAMC